MERSIFSQFFIAEPQRLACEVSCSVASVVVNALELVTDTTHIGE